MILFFKSIRWDNKDYHKTRAILIVELVSNRLKRENL